MPTPELALKRIAECKATKSKSLDLGRCGLTEWPEELWELTWLEELNLRNRITDDEKNIWISATKNKGSFNTLHYIPYEIQNLNQLKKLELGGSGFVYGEAATGILDVDKWDISDLSALSGLTNLQSLNMGSMSVSNLSHLSGLSNLQNLNIQRTEVRDLDVLSGLTKLQSLNVRSTKISDFSHLSGLANLQSLNIGSTSVSDLSHLSGLTNLQSLNIGSTSVSDLSHLSGLTNLQSLNIGRTSVSDLSHLSGLKKLQSLNVQNTKISDLSMLSGLNNLQSLNIGSTSVYDLRHLSGLTKLQSLNVQSAKISDLSMLSGLNNLQSLNIGSTSVSDLSHLSSLTKLQSLNLERTLVSDLSYLSGLSNLQSLNIRETKISGLSDLSGLANLQSLNLWGTKINSLTALNSLANLQDLNLYNTNISDLSVLGNLKKLLSLDVDNIPVSDLSILSDLKTLRNLHVGYNSRISDFSVLRGLINLRSLNIVHTKVSDLSFVRDMPNLQKLGISKTQVNNLEPLLPLIKKGIEVLWKETSIEGILVNECPLVSPSPEIAKQGNEAILKYFEDLEKQGEEKLYEAKLLILGEGGAGKTSLARKLLDSDSKLPEEEETTKGIEITKLHFDREDGEEFCINVWDFGGQEIYHATHQFFLTKRSLYVMVDDTRSSDTDVNDKSFNYWLQTVELFGDGSPLLIVQNEKADRSKALDMRSMRSKFDFVKEDLQTNLHTGRGLKEIGIEIRHQIQQLPHVGMTLPKRWVKVREAIGKLSAKKSYISWERYSMICEGEEIDDLDQMKRLSRTLHDLGVFLHFEEDDLLKRSIILQNEWATEAVYKVIDDEEVKKAKGRFKRSDTPRIWKESKYADMHGELMALMLRFEICYELDEADHFLIPQLLPGSQPTTYEWDENDNLQIRFRYGFMPKGLLSRFIVRFHRYVGDLDKAWKSGVVLERRGAEAEVRETYNESEIAVRVRGKNRKELMTLIKEEFDKLHASYMGIKVKTFIPCNCDECQEGDPYFFSEEVLEKARRKGRMTIECQKSFEQVAILPLIEEVFIQGFRETEEEKRPRRKKSPQRALKGFVSYAHEDRDYQKEFSKHLDILKRTNILDTWVDSEILAGQAWDEEIMSKLEEADVIFLLISIDFLTSDFIQTEELRVAMKKHEAKTARVIPIILRECAWKNQEFAKLQAANTRPVADMDKDKAWTAIDQEIRRSIANFLEE